MHLSKSKLLKLTYDSIMQQCFFMARILSRVGYATMKILTHMSKQLAETNITVSFLNIKE